LNISLEYSNCKPGRFTADIGDFISNKSIRYSVKARPNYYLDKLEKSLLFY